MESASRIEPGPKQRGWLPIAVLVVGLGLTVAATLSYTKFAEAREQRRFDVAVKEIQETLQTRLEAYIALLRGGSALLALKSELSRAEWQNFVQRLRIQEFYPGVQGIGVSLKISPAETNNFVLGQRQQGFTNFHIHPGEPKSEYHIITYLEPMDKRNALALGYDMYSDPIRQAAMDMAMLTGLPAASGRVRLLQELESPGQPGFLIYVPVYNGGEVPEDPAERRRQLRGFVYSPFRAGDLFSALLGSSDDVGLQIAVYDSTNRAAASLLYRFPEEANAPNPRHASVRHVTVAGRPWHLEFASLAQFHPRSSRILATLIPIGGTLLSLLLYYFTRREAVARRAAELSAVQLAEQREHLRVTLTSIGEGVITTDRFGRIDLMNGPAQTMTGWSIEAARGKPLAEVFSILNGKTGEPEDDPVARIMRDGKSAIVSGDAVLVARDGVRRLIDDNAAPILDSQLRLSGVVLVFRDATVRKKAEAFQTFQARQSLLRADTASAFAQPGLPFHAVLHRCVELLVQHVPAAFARIWTLNPETDILKLQASSGLYTHLDGPHSKVPVGKFKIGLIAKEARPHLTNSVLTDPRISDPQWARTEGMVAFAGYPLMSGGHVIGVMALFARHSLAPETLEMLAGIADIIAQGIQRKRAEDALEQANRDLERRVQERTAKLQEAISELEAFSYSVSHDMRAPLRAMQSFSLILKEEAAAKLDPDQTEYLQRIIKASDRLDQLIHDVLAYSRISRSTLELHRIDVEKLVHEVVQQHPALQPPKAEIVIKSPLLPLLGDKSSLMQCLSNLMTNAVKFVAPGTVPRVVVSTERIGTEVRLWIEDNGIGIPPEYRDKIFGLFQRLHGEAAYEGTGIGLAIVKKAVQRMEGEVGVESEEGKGSRFWIQLQGA